MSGRGYSARGLLVVLSGPSGVGKTTVMDRLLARPGFERVVTATTREPRGDEVDGEDYLFLGEQEFAAREEAGEFLEHARVHGQLYGTPRDQVERMLERRVVCLLGIDVRGAAQIRGRIEPALFVFLRPPDQGELLRRLSSRGSEAPEDVARRLETAKAEFRREGEYDVSVVNDDLDRTIEELRSLIESKREELDSCPRT